MTNPTLVGQDTPWGGFTLDAIVEALLAMRGLTNDAATLRTVASVTEDADCKRFIRSAIDDLNTRFPSVWSIRNYTVAWVAGDHSLNLPANCGSVLAVTFNGLSLRPLSRDDYYRIKRGDDEGGGVSLGSTGIPGYYRIVGFSNTADADPRLVLQLYPTPSAADELIVEYVSVGPEIATDTFDIPLGLPFQRWTLCRAAEIWGSERGDDPLVQRQERERLKVEETLHSWFDAMREKPTRATTRYPHVTRQQRYRRG